MDHFVIDGLWWLPGTPGARCPGSLRFDEDGLRLELHGRLREIVPSAQGVVGVGRASWTTEAVIHGRSHDGEQLSVLGASGYTDGGPASFVTNTLDVDLILRGSHADGDRFDAVWFSFDYLDAWASPPDLRIEDGSRDWEEIRVRFGTMTLEEARLAKADLRLVMRVLGTGGGRSVHLDRVLYFVARPDEPMPAQRIVDEFVRPLQDFLMFCIGLPIVLTELRLQPTDREDPGEMPSAHFRMVQQRSAGAVSFAAVENYDRPTILTLRASPAPFPALMTRWFERWADWRDVLELLHSPLYAPFMFIEHGYSSTFQSAEALHDQLLSTKDRSKEEHQARVTAVAEVLGTSDLGEADRVWAVNVLRGQNHKSLRQKIDDLLAITGAVGEAVRGADPSFGQAASRIRTGVSHGGADKSVDPAYRYWAMQVLRWTVRTLLLAEVLDDAEAAYRKVADRHGFGVAVKRLAEARGASGHSCGA